MYNASAATGYSNTEYKNRLYEYEIVGLSQSGYSDNSTYAIRKSGSIFRTVPYHRMNQEMRRITRLGGQIVNIKPLSDGSTSEDSTETVTEKTENK